MPLLRRLAGSGRGCRGSRAPAAQRATATCSASHLLYRAKFSSLRWPYSPLETASSTGAPERSPPSTAGPRHCAAPCCRPALGGTPELSLTRFQYHHHHRLSPSNF